MVVTGATTVARAAMVVTGATTVARAAMAAAGEEPCRVERAAAKAVGAMPCQGGTGLFSAAQGRVAGRKESTQAPSHRTGNCVPHQAGSTSPCPS